MIRLADIADTLGLTLRGDGSCAVSGIATLEQATDQHLSFVSKQQYLSLVADTKAAALILHPDWADAWTGPCLLSEQPYLSFARATEIFDNRPVASGGTHCAATIHPSARLGANVTVDAGAVIEANAVVGDHVWVGANAYVGDGVHIGAHTRIHPGVVLYYGVRIGQHCTIHGNAVIGADGFGFAPSDEGWIKILQLGSVSIGDRVEIGAGTTVDRGALEDTILEDNVILDDQVHVGHNVFIGAGTGIAACTGIGGSTRIGRGCTLAGMVGVGDHIELADNVHVNGQGRVSKSLTAPGLYASGTPIQPYREWSKNAVRFEQLATMAKRLAKLEKQLAALGEPETPDQGDPS